MNMVMNHEHGSVSGLSFVITLCRAHPGQLGPWPDCQLHCDELHAHLCRGTEPQADLQDGHMEPMSCVHSFCLDAASVDRLGVCGPSAWQLLTVNGTHVAMESCRLWNTQGHGPNSLGREVFTRMSGGSDEPTLTGLLFHKLLAKMKEPSPNSKPRGNNHCQNYVKY